MQTETTIDNRLDQLFKTKKSSILSIYFTAGYPKLNDTVPIMEYLQDSGADIIEVGIPFSDPIADGPTIQASGNQAILQGMSVRTLLDQLQDIRKKIHIPILLMGYLNPVLQYGFEAFCEKCRQIGIDGLIIPDMPLAEYQEIYKPNMDANGLFNIFLITPQTPESRVREIDNSSRGFIYMVSSASITGAKKGISDHQIQYFQRIRDMDLKNPALIGFGISDKQSFEKACEFSRGAIIGSAFIQVLSKSVNLKEDTQNFITSIIA
ncbi:MAG: tryptophan synthase subunit alpha [Cyclobacteriaceae bacterium]|nr:tryptophan synthase subunit alpha [Cyclobacteriaceae bacterium]